MLLRGACIVYVPQAALAAALKQCTAITITAAAADDTNLTADNSGDSAVELAQLRAELGAYTNTIAVLEQQLSETQAALLTALLKPQVHTNCTI
jgi:hypothetical protein